MQHPVEMARNLKGWSQTDLARESGIAASTISRIENGQRGSLWSFRRLAAALGVSDYRRLIPADDAPSSSYSQSTGG